MADERTPRTYDRRAFLGVVGAAGTAGTAAGLGSRSFVEVASAGTSRASDQTFVSVMQVSPEDVQFNPFNYEGWSEDVADVMFDKLARYNYATGEMVPELLSGWTHTDSALELSLREGAAWHDGDPVTSRDLQTHFELADLASRPVADYYDGVRTTDDRTVVLELSETTNPTLLEHELLRRHAVVKHEAYAEYLSMSGSKVESALREYAPAPDVGNGPFEFANRDSGVFRLERFAGYPDAGNVQFTDYEFVYRPGDQRVRDALREPSVDGVPKTGSATRSFVADLPETVVTARIPDKWGLGLAVDHDDEHVGRRPVRQAMMHVIDEQAVVDDQDHFKRPASLPCGLDPDDVDRWIDDRDAFEEYDSESSAETLLRDAGYSREDGTWTDSDGIAISVSITVPSSWRDWVSAVELIVSQLADFGFDASVRGVDNYFGALAEGDYTVIATSWLPGTPRASVPYYALQAQFIPEFIYDHDYYTTGSVTVQERNGSGTTAIDYVDRLVDLASTASRDDARSIVTEVAWLVNQSLPVLPIMSGETVSFLTDDVWEVPPAGDDVYQVHWPTSHLVRTGDLGPLGRDSRSTPSTETESGTATSSDTSAETSIVSETDTPISTTTATRTQTETGTRTPIETRTRSETETPVMTEDGEDDDGGNGTFIDEILDDLV